MAILDTLNRKINELKTHSPEELDKMTRVLDIIKSAKEALDDEQKLIDYDFDIAINLVKHNVKSYGIIDLNKSINDIKNFAIVRTRYNQNDIAYSEEYQRVRRYFKDRLDDIARDLNDLIKEEKNKKTDNELVGNLEDLKKLIEGKGRRKYYTYDMLESLFEVIDYDSLSYEDIKELTKALAVSKNTDGINLDLDNKEEVIGLLKEYLGDRLDINLIEKYKIEICSMINLDNARKILELFKSENIINRFDPVALLIILLRGKYEFVSNFYYEEVLPRDEKLQDMYFEHIMSCVWINEKKADRKYTKTIKVSNDKENRNLLCGSIPDVCNEDVLENIRILKENEDLFSEKYDLSNLRDLWILTKPTWLLKKNLELFRLFGVYDISISAISQTDLEDKINLVVELGLLNPPRNNLFREIEKTVPKYREFITGRKRKTYSGGILNYYGRNSAQIGLTPYFEYIFWFYKMQRCGKEAFYGDFFSEKRAGTRSTEDYDDSEKKLMSSTTEMDKLINDSFANNHYSLSIDKYNIYKEAIREFKESPHGDVVIPYFDDSILEEELVQKLEVFNISDEYVVNGEKKEYHNPYVYVFGQTIISRYKVLRNLTILKKQFGDIDENMLLTAIVDNSYIDIDTFETIRESIRKGGLERWTI